MTDYPGHPPLQAEMAEYYIRPLRTTFAPDPTFHMLIGGLLSKQAIPQVSPEYSGKLLPEYTTREAALGGAFLSPTDINAGVILDDAEYNVSVWNSSPDTNYVITEIAEENSEGILIDHPTLPITLWPGVERTHIVTVLQTGPPTQFSTVNYLISGREVEITISGLRVISWLYEPDFKAGVDEGYIFETALNRSEESFVEQRRALREEPLRSFKGTFKFAAPDAEYESLVHQIREFAKTPVAFPIFTEPIFLAENPLNKKVLATTDTLAYHWNANNYADLVLFKDMTNMLQNDLYEVNLWEDNQFTLETFVLNTYEPESLVVYPCMIALLSSVRGKMITDSVFSAEIEFIEMRTPDE